MEIFGYEFVNGALLEEALTTPSYRMTEPLAHDNQRLEFLGDAVLGLLSAERLYARFPGEDEGALTVRRTHLVSSAALCEAAERVGLAARLRRNKGADALPKNAKTLADAIEAILGAAYLDGGFDAARRVFEALDLFARAQETVWSANPKGELQVKAQAMKPPRHPAYELLKVEGKAHDPLFTVRVTVDGVGGAVASARTRKEAEALAAARLLQESERERA